MRFSFILLAFANFFANLSAESKYCRIADQQTNEFVKDVCESYGLILEGSGGAMMFDIQKFTLRFSANKNATVEEARFLMVNCVEKFVNQINQAKEIRPYLHEFPFSEMDFDLMISFKDNEGRFMDKAYIAMVCMGKGKLFYNISQKQSCLDEFYEETYEVARKIVKSQMVVAQ